jgi:hypothetical protein
MRTAYDTCVAYGTQTPTAHPYGRGEVGLRQRAFLQGVYARERESSLERERARERERGREKARAREIE